MRSTPTATAPRNGAPSSPRATCAARSIAYAASPSGSAARSKASPRPQAAASRSSWAARRAPSGSPRRCGSSKFLPGTAARTSAGSAARSGRSPGQQLARRSEGYLPATFVTGVPSSRRRRRLRSAGARRHAPRAHVGVRGNRDAHRHVRRPPGVLRRPGRPLRTGPRKQRVPRRVRALGLAEPLARRRRRAPRHQPRRTPARRRARHRAGRRRELRGPDAALARRRRPGAGHRGAGGDAVDRCPLAACDGAHRVPRRSRGRAAAPRRAAGRRPLRALARPALRRGARRLVQARQPRLRADAGLHRPRAALAPVAGFRAPRRPRDDAGRDPGARAAAETWATS